MVNMQLRDDVFFHDGSQLTARDVQFSFERALESWEAMPVLEAVDGVTVHDDFNFTIHLLYPFAPILRHLSHPVAGIVPMDYVSRVGNYRFAANPIGSGPFMFAEQTSDELILTRNDNYWGELPQMESVVLMAGGYAEARARWVDSGLADIAINITPTASIFQEDQPVPSAIQIASESNNSILMRSPSAGIDYIGFNTSIAPFDNPLVRQAINYALGGGYLIEAASLGGIGLPATLPLANNVWGHVDVAPFTADLDRARELLAEAGYPDGFSTSIWYNIPNWQRLAFAEAARARLALIGIYVEVEGLEWETYLDMTAAGEHDMFILGWPSVAGDPDYALFSLFHSAFWGAAGNRFFLDIPELDALLEAGRAELDPTRRAEIYAEILQILRDNPPTVPIRQGEHFAAVADNVRGLTLDPLGHHRFATVYFAD